MMRFLGLRCQEIFGPRPYLYADGNYVVKIQERKKDSHPSVSMQEGPLVPRLLENTKIRYAQVS